MIKIFIIIKVFAFEIKNGEISFEVMFVQLIILAS